MSEAAARVVPTVLGEVPVAELGATNVHEHLLMRDPVLPGEELDDVERSAQEAANLRDSGFAAVVELTPLGLGRDPEGLAEIARRSGLHVVMATGVHHEGHYPADHPLRELSGDDLAARFAGELSEGVGPGLIRAGVIKVGAGYWRISPFERRVLEAAGAAHRATDAPVVCHLERGTAAFEVLELLASAGVRPERVLLAHIDRNPDPGLHAELAAAGAYLGYDGWARPKYFPDSTLIDCLVACARDGGAERIVLGGDAARRSALRAYGGLPGLGYIGERVLPRLRRAGGEALVETVTVTNPQRLLGRRPHA
jgi:predicted metal-dependent phosphotriesterase family hydrolase